MSRAMVTRLLRYGTPILLIVLWWAGTASSTSLYFPPLSEIMGRFVEVWTGPSLGDDLLPSVARFLIGFSVSLVVGVAAGTLLGLWPRLRRDVSPVTEFCRSLPVGAIVPIPLLLVGPGLRMDVSLIIFASFFPILLATSDGVRGVEPVTVQTARVYGLNRWQTLWHVVLPAAMPQIFAGIRVALAIGIAAMVIAGMLGSAHGVGAYVILAQQSFDVVSTWAGLIMIGLIGVVINGLFLLVQRRVLAWHTGWRSASVASR
jgi:ABC-type nitrate/sulfonate/bicarbonate transport system permease component